MRQNSLTMNIIQSVVVTVVMAVLGGTIKVYLDVHDLKLMVTEQKGQIDWLYHYTFPKKE